ncbi:MAG: hypothetical protein GY729_19995 [Desulfobacteraceae bacterium]|nr:hypothetical protein [Desulfobacteraceae bacterium]
MSNIGCVLYKKGDEPGILIARFCHTDDGNGTGVATGTPSDDFEGIYRIRYYDEKENFQDERELVIQKNGDQYQVSWLDKGKVTAIGMGMETAKGLAVGYTNIEK